VRWRAICAGPNQLSEEVSERCAVCLHPGAEVAELAHHGGLRGVPAEGACCQSLAQSACWLIKLPRWPVELQCLSSILHLASSTEHLVAQASAPCGSNFSIFQASGT
jgi:hypothetical protein